MTTNDRGAVIHACGRHRLSPALEGQARPALSERQGDGLERCGWQRFFAAMRGAGLAIDAGGGEEPPRLAPPAAVARPAPLAGLASATAAARRFLGALRG